MDSLKIKKEKMHPEVLVVSWIVKRSFSFLEESNLLCVHFTWRNTLLVISTKPCAPSSTIFFLTVLDTFKISSAFLSVFDYRELIILQFLSLLPLLLYMSKVNFTKLSLHSSDVVLVSLLLTLNIFHILF